MSILQLFPDAGNFKTCPNCLTLKPGANFNRCATKKDGLSTYCKECDSVLRKARYRENQERELANAKVRREGNRAYAKEYNKRYNETHKDSLREARRQWLESNREKHREACKQWLKNNPEKAREMNRKKRRRYVTTNWDKVYAHNLKYREANREKINAINRRGKHRRQTNGGSYTEEQWQHLCGLFGNSCACCGKSKKLTVDHVIPVSMGGTSDILNLQPLCGSCNSKKHATAVDYRRKDVIEALQALVAEDGAT